MNSLNLSGDRPTSDEYFLTMAILASMRGTCARRRVGCILTNTQNHVIATGYNGVASKQPHCTSIPCPGAMAETGKDLDKCYAIHAEQNALLQCKDVREIFTCYTTVAMCVTCTKLLLNTGCKRIVFLEPYQQSNISEKLWKAAGGQWIQLKTPSLWETIYALKRTLIPSYIKLDTSDFITQSFRSEDIGVGHGDQRSQSIKYWPRSDTKRRICGWHFRGDRRR